MIDFTKFKPIETEFDGYRFRSRLEARWAVFFKILCISYEYEKEGYIVEENIAYLPDFWLSEQKCWIEIKGRYPSDEETEKAKLLTGMTRFPVYIFFGAIPNPFDIHDVPQCHYFVWISHEEGLFAGLSGVDIDSGYRWCECPDCGQFGITYNGCADRLKCKDLCPKYSREDRGHNYDTPKLIEAYHAARSARFESFSTRKAIV